MKYYVIINGESSLDIQGLAIESLPSISKPLMRSKREEIDGRNGDIITQLGYGAYDKTLKIGLWGDYDINEVITFFNQDGIITFSNEPDMYYNFTILNRIDFINQLEAFRKATITIHCQPFKYKEEETEELEIITKEVSGTDISVNDAVDGAMNIILKGNTSQVQLSGKNLLKNVATTDTINGITFKVNEDDSITISGTASAQTVFKLTPTPNETLSLKAGSYTLSTGITLPADVTIQLWYSSATTLITFAEGFENKTFNVASDTDYTNFRGQIVIANGKSFTTPITIYPMLRLSSTTSEYEQYCGGTPSPNPSYPQDIHNVSGNNSVVVCGKNLCNNISLNLALVYTNETIITDASSGTMYAKVPKNTDITITKTDITNRFRVGLLNKIPEANDTFHLVYRSDNSSVLTTTINTGEYEYVAVQYTNQSQTTNIMINVGTQPTTYEAYNGITYPINLPVENLFDKDNMNTLNAYINGTGKIVTDTQPSVLYIACKPNTTYTITKPLQTTQSGNRYRYGCCSSIPTISTQLSKYVTFSGGTTETIQTFTTDSTANYLVFNYAGGSIGEYQAVINGIQIEYGSKPNTYTPYGTTPIELNKIGTYQDYFYKDSDKWYLHKEIGKVVLDGSENYNFPNSVLQSSDELPNDIKIIDNTLNALSNNFVYHYYPIGITANIQNGEFGWNSSKKLTFKIDDFTTKQQYIDWFGTHNTIIYYQLATPTNTEITDTTLIEQLEAIKSANSYYGTTNINQVNNDMPFILDVSYLSGTDNITITNHGNYFSKPKLTLTGTGNIGIYLNDSQIFQVALGTDETIIIDTDKMEAYYESTLKNRQVIGDYNSFKLLSGENTIKISGTFSKLQVDNYSRWI